MASSWALELPTARSGYGEFRPVHPSLFATGIQIGYGRLISVLRAINLLAAVVIKLYDYGIPPLANVSTYSRGIVTASDRWPLVRMADSSPAEAKTKLYDCGIRTPASASMYYKGIRIG